MSGAENTVKFIRLPSIMYITKSSSIHALGGLPSNTLFIAMKTSINRWQQFLYEEYGHPHHSVLHYPPTLFI